MASKASKFHGRVEGRAARCAIAGCGEPGEFRAPLSPGGFDGPGTWRLLCLAHVREHNSRYNFFAGMSVEEIEAAQSPIAGWDRSVRAFSRAGADPAPAWGDFRDPLDAIAERFRRGGGSGPRADRFTPRERDAMAVLGLAGDSDRTALRRRYSQLVRLYHPDRNGGDRSHEAKLGRVIDAYQLLKGAPAFA